MSELFALIVGLVLGILFVVTHPNVVNVNTSIDGSKWVKHDGQKYRLIPEIGGVK